KRLQLEVAANRFGKLLGHLGADILLREDCGKLQGGLVLRKRGQRHTGACRGKHGGAQKMAPGKFEFHEFLLLMAKLPNSPFPCEPPLRIARKTIVRNSSYKSTWHPRVGGSTSQLQDVTSNHFCMVYFISSVIYAITDYRGYPFWHMSTRPWAMLPSGRSAPTSSPASCRPAAGSGLNRQGHATM